MTGSRLTTLQTLDNESLQFSDTEQEMSSEQELFLGEYNTFSLTSPSDPSQTSLRTAELRFPLVVVGGGAGGMGTVNKFVNKFGKGEVCLIDPAAEHFNQSQWTLVGKVLL